MYDTYEKPQHMRRGVDPLGGECGVKPEEETGWRVKVVEDGAGGESMVGW